ncbi:transposase (plasmid) [Flammeovirga pectinis]|uniref:Transposase n=1 Tax=Flammeovirga pectinis TaxID=2494373 RepID=A0A3Q9FR12_9BACT|nr:transposase [Flammeovirga pectinis]AZQ65640.1 transposase [Flammeovirga pectinis]
MISLSTFSSFRSFEFDGFSVDESNTVKKRIIHLKSVSPSGKCPCCHTESNSKHSYYVRNLKDISWSNSSIEVSLKVKKFYCTNIHCSMKIFTERFTQDIQPYVRSTTRLQHQLMVLGLTIGVRALQRISSHLQLEYSTSSFLRFAHLFQVNDTNKLTINCLDIDDWRLKNKFPMVLF